MTNPTGLPYTPVVRAGDWVVVSGQIGLRDGELVGGGFDDELRQALANLEARLTEGGASMADVVKTTVFLRHMTDYGRMNEVYGAAFPEPRPARSAFGVAELPLGALVEIEAWAFVGPR
jgi:2-iminobutanoate/2-iminopropanoate deaminase